MKNTDNKSFLTALTQRVGPAYVLTDPSKTARYRKGFRSGQGEALAVDRTDGISMSFVDWRFNLRSSNTEPVVRLNVESRGDIPLMEARTRTLLALLNQ